MSGFEPQDLAPGLPEAVDPGTGNGVAWAQAAHERALRHPDPLQALAALTDATPPEPETNPATAAADLPETGHQDPLFDSSAGTDPAGQTESPKKVKAGKRVRKAAESVRKRRSPDDHPPPQKQSRDMRPEGLSPFVTWLKSLSGSEYVHPYEEEGLSDILDGRHQEVASETLADLLAAQGYVDRAVAMYEALMYKIPEKSSFFAAKIKALK